MLLHLLLGFLLIVPFLVFGFAHLATSWKRPNKTAIRYRAGAPGRWRSSSWCRGWCWSGSAASRSATRGSARSATGCTSLAPLAAIALYVKHRLAGPRIRWDWARRFGVAVVGFVVLMGLLHSQDPRSFGVKGPKEGKQYFYPVRGRHGQRQVHPGRDADDGRLLPEVPQGRLRRLVPLGAPFQLVQQQGRISSASARRGKVALERDGTTQAARWCAGCHDPVPFFSGEFDDPNYDDVNNPTSQAGITCTACHAITNVNNTRGNAAYTIEEPQHYPFASSDDPLLQWINQTLVKAKPEMHKKTFLKPVIKDAEFCSTCHKVGLPYGVNHYKDFVRGQNHYDPFLLSGVSGHGAQSFYYPDGRQDQLQRVPHGAEAVDRLRRQGLRRQGRPRDPRPLLPRRQHRAWPPSSATARPPSGTPGS